MNEKLSFFLFDLNGGGAERVITTLLNQLHHEGNNVELILAKKEGPYLEELNKDIKIITLQAKTYFQILISLYFLLLKNKSSHLITTMRGPSIIALIVKLLLPKKIKLIIREANTPSQEHKVRNIKGTLLNTFTQALYSTADSIICVSEGVRSDFISFYRNVNPKKISTIYNPVVDESFLAKSKLPVLIQAPWNEDTPFFLAVGRFVEQKDYPTLLKAFQIVAKERMVNLVILGEGPLREAFLNESKNLGLGPRVWAPGFIDNPYPYMREAMAFVLTSRWEGLPNSLIQAIALGKRAVATDCPSGPKEILENGRLGKLVSMGDYQTLAKEMISIIDDNNPNTEDVELIKAAEKRFSVRSVTKQYLENIRKS